MYSSKPQQVTCHKIRRTSLFFYIVKGGSEMSFFGFGAFSTPVGQLIGELRVLLALDLPVHTRAYKCLSYSEKSTDNAASAGNLALHLQICDIVNETDNG